MSRFWYRVNRWVADHIWPEVPDLPVRSVAPDFDFPTPFRAAPVGEYHGPHPFQIRIINGPSLTQLTSPGYLPPRAWWDQSNIPNAAPAEPPEHLDLSALDLIRNNWKD